MGYSLNTKYRPIFHECSLIEFTDEATVILTLIVVNVESDALSKLSRENPSMRTRLSVDLVVNMHEVCQKDKHKTIHMYEMC